MKTEWRNLGASIILPTHDILSCDVPNGVKVAEEIVTAVNDNERLRVMGEAYNKAAVKFADENRALRKALQDVLDNFVVEGETRDDGPDVVSRAKELLTETHFPSEEPDEESHIM